MSTAVAEKPKAPAPVEKTINQKLNVRVGQIVHWWADPTDESEPMAAIVSKVGMDHVCLNVVGPSTYNFMIRDGVRFKHGLKNHPVDVQENGVWDFTPETKRLEEIEKTLVRLAATK